MATASCPQKVVPVVVTKIDTLIDLGEDECLEGTTERSDGNRVRSARIGEARTMCLEGTTPQDRAKATGVLPSRQFMAMTYIRGLRPRLPSLRSVLPSRQIALNEILLPTNYWEIFFLPTNCTNGHE